VSNFAFSGPAYTVPTGTADFAWTPVGVTVDLESFSGGLPLASTGFLGRVYLLEGSSVLHLSGQPAFLMLEKPLSGSSRIVLVSDGYVSTSQLTGAITIEVLDMYALAGIDLILASAELVVPINIALLDDGAIFATTYS
jgi:hypothetical protein